MKCENCGIEMRPAARICHECQYNHLLKRKMGSRQPPAPEEPKGPKESTGRAVQAPRPIIRRRSSGELPETAATTTPEDNLIRFPYTHGSGVTEDSGSTVDSQLPEWRQRVRDKVREAREKRGGEAGMGSPRTVPDEVSTDRNPLVESALKRIKRATPSVTPLPVGNRAAASAAKAFEVEIDEDSVSATPREKRAVESQGPDGQIHPPAPAPAMHTRERSIPQISASRSSVASAARQSWSCAGNTAASLGR